MIRCFGGTFEGVPAYRYAGSPISPLAWISRRNVRGGAGSGYQEEHTPTGSFISAVSLAILCITEQNLAVITYRKSFCRSLSLQETVSPESETKVLKRVSFPGVDKISPRTCWISLTSIPVLLLTCQTKPILGPRR